MKFWKTASKFMLAGAIVGSLAACGNGNGSDNNDSNTEADSNGLAGTTISIGIWGGNAAEEATMEKMLAEFTEQTGIIVEPRVYTDYQTQLQTELMGGTAPDIFYVEAFLFPSLVQEGVLAPLDEFIAATPDFNENDFFAPSLDAFRHEGSIYGLPKDLSTLGLYYNVNLLAEAGFTPEDIPTEMADLPAFLAELAPNLPAGVVPAITTSELARHMFVLQANGTSVVDEDGLAQFTQPGQLEYLQMLVDAFQDGLVQRPADLGQDWSGNSFGLEAAAIMIEGNWANGHLGQNFPDVEFGTRELPTMNGENGSMMFTVSWSINAASENAEAAWKFVDFMTNTQGMADWAGGASLIPSRASSAEALDLENDPILAPFAAAAAYATPWQNGTTLPIVMREFNNLLPSALNGDMTLEEAMAEAERVANNDIETQLR